MKAINKILATITVCAALSMINQPVEAANSQQWYSVKKGDSYYSISQEFGINISNFDVDTTLKIDDKIEIPEYELIEYTVKNGDTIYSLAQENNIKQDWLYMANQMDEDDKLVLDSTIFIPVKNKSSKQKEDVKPKEIQLSKTEESFKKTQGSEQIVSTSPEKEYTIQKGDTLLGICQSKGISLKKVLQLNSFIKNANKIFIGQKLSIAETMQVNEQPVENNCQQDKPNYDFSGMESLINNYKDSYPEMKIGVGIYDLTSDEYIYKQNIYTQISSACTIKAAYAAYVLRSCANSQIDIDEFKIMYRSNMKNNGSGIIKNMQTNQEFSIRYLLTQLIEISDNTAYNVLLSKFGLSGFQEYLNTIGGQNLNGCRYGSCTVAQRINEWKAINQYCNSGETNGNVLKELLANAKYSYLAQGFTQWHTYLHKSGWADGTSYNSCSDCMIVENYIIVVLTHDYADCIAHTNVVRSIGTWCDKNIF